MPAVDFKLYLIGDRNQTVGRPLPEIIREAGRAGVSAVQFREKDLSPRDQLALASQIATVTKALGMKLLINDRIDLCLALDAEGVHLPSSGFPIGVARRMLGQKNGSGSLVIHGRRCSGRRRRGPISRCWARSMRPLPSVAMARPWASIILK